MLLLKVSETLNQHLNVKFLVVCELELAASLELLLILLLSYIYEKRLELSDASSVSREARLV